MNDAQFNLARQLLAPHADKHQLFMNGLVPGDEVRHRVEFDIREAVLNHCAMKLGTHMIRNGELVMQSENFDKSLQWRASLWAFRSDQLCQLVYDAYQAGVESTKVKL